MERNAIAERWSPVQVSWNSAGCEVKHNCPAKHQVSLWAGMKAACAPLAFGGRSHQTRA
jgi:hypothetical protein